MPANPSRPQLRNYTGIVLALALLLVVGIAMVWSSFRTAASYGWVDHTYRVMTMLHDYQAEAIAAESAARGYRLTGDPLLREQFYRALPRIDNRLDALDALVVDNPEQQQRIRRLRELTTQRMAVSQRLVALTVDGTDSSAGRQLVATGARAMKAIDAQTVQALKIEQTLLAQRNTDTTREAAFLFAFTGLGMTFAIGLLIAQTRGLHRENLRSQALERQTRNAAEVLQQSMAQLALLSEQRAALGRYASLLQSCQDVREALRITGRTVAELIPGCGGRCYLLRSSQDLAESAIVFGSTTITSHELMKPEQCWGLRRSKPYSVEHLATGIACEHVDATAVPAKAWSICIPLLAQGVPLGLLHVCQDEGVDHAQAQQLLENIAEQLGLALVNLQLRDRLRVQSLRDPLTGLFNRRYLDESLPREIARCRQQGQPLAVLMLDIDHFKSFNDGNGHAAGDALLAGVGQTLLAQCRSDDLACRYGGEEFTVVLAHTDAEHALRRAEEIRTAIAATMVQYLRRPLAPCTASIGLAMLPQDGTTAEDLLARADAALYRAKAEGRDRVVPASATAA